MGLEIFVETAWPRFHNTLTDKFEVERQYANGCFDVTDIVLRDS